MKIILITPSDLNVTGKVGPSFLKAAGVETIAFVDYGYTWPYNDRRGRWPGIMHSNTVHQQRATDRYDLSNRGGPLSLMTGNERYLVVHPQHVEEVEQALTDNGHEVIKRPVQGKLSTS